MMGKLTDQQIETAASLSYARFMEVRHDYSARKWDALTIAERTDWKDAIEVGASKLQYAPTAPGAPLSDDEWSEFCRAYGNDVEGWRWARTLLNCILAKRNTAPTDREKVLEAAIRWRASLRRRARLSPQKTPEERVKVKRLGASEAVFVYADGYIVGPEFDTEKDAERYRIGLIAELTKKSR